MPLRKLMASILLETGFPGGMTQRCAYGWRRQLVSKSLGTSPISIALLIRSLMRSRWREPPTLSVPYACAP